MKKSELEQLVAALWARLARCDFTYEITITDEDGAAIKMVVWNFNGCASISVTDSDGKVHDTAVLENGDTLIMTIKNHPNNNA
jgi:hypothetical protein